MRNPHNYIYLKILYLRKENRCLHVIHHDSIAIHSLSTHQLSNGYLAELPTILDIFPGIANTTITPIGVVGSHKVAGKGYVNTKNSQMSSISATLSSMYHTKQAKLMAKLISQSRGELQQAISCPGKLEPFKDNLSTH